MTSDQAFVLQAMETEIQSHTGGPVPVLGQGFIKACSAPSDLLTQGAVDLKNIDHLTQWVPSPKPIEPRCDSDDLPIRDICFFLTGPPKPGDMSVRSLGFHIYHFS